MTKQDIYDYIYHNTINPSVLISMVDEYLEENKIVVTKEAKVATEEEDK